MKKEYLNLLKIAKEASKNSYSPYSKFKVGAALLTSKGKIYKGTNVENSSYGLTNCAERSAIFNAISAGDKNIKAIAIWTKQKNVFPCGACRQVILEICPNADIIINTKKVFKISQLLPYEFSGKNLK